MATAFKWFELVIKNWAVFVPILLFMGSAIGWTTTNSALTEKRELNQAMKGTIESLVGYKPRAVNQKCDCNAIFSKLIKKHEAKHRSEH